MEMPGNCKDVNNIFTPDAEDAEKIFFISQRFPFNLDSSDRIIETVSVV